MIIVVFAVLTLVSLVYLYITNSYRYWEKKNVPSLAVKFPYGNLDPSVSMSLLCQKLYNDFKAAGNRNHGGVYFFTSPSYMPIDTEIMKNILVKDHAHFISRGMYNNPKQPISEHLIALSGEKWKFVRTKLSPTFTSGKMKMMFGTLEKCSKPLVDRINKSTNSDINIKDALMRYTMDVIGNTAFGLECDSFGGTDTAFLEMGTQAMRQGKLRDFLILMAMIFPNIFRTFNFQAVLPKVEKFYSGIIEEVCQHREKTGTTRNDFIQMLIDLKNAKADGSEKAFTLDMIKAQAFAFFVAGFETSSSTATFALFELAKNPEVQDEVREEIRNILKKNNGVFTYDGVLEMKYLSQIIDEALRLYPVIPVLNRQCTSTYKEPKTGLIIEKGTNVLISVIGLHHDPEYYPDPEVFDPDRFSEESKKNIHPYTWMPFGEGNMSCIGMRFGLMQTRLALAKLLENHRFSLSKRTRSSLEFDTSFTLMPKEDVYLDVRKVN